MTYADAICYVGIAFVVSGAVSFFFYTVLR